ncbi:MAG: tRNA (guanosine(37)-N1)-methyltransferase TrmD [Candidatus Pacebacteria bacterium]|nr:tRNA (guanosine(37)-N1)-methyltransferase TrmD [Candidatus Paceibacterota bacterium]
MQFDIITIFPKMFDSYFSEGVLSRALKKNQIKINVHDLRKYSNNRHNKVDDTPFGGGVGMIIKVEPVYRALLDLKIIKKDGTRTQKSQKNTKVFLMSAKGEQYNQKSARELADLKRIILICGRYEGVDERVAKYLVDGEISVGEYILTGGEIPAMIVIDSVSRLIGGVLGNEESIVNESFAQSGYIEHPYYTRPDIFSPNKNIKWEVPEVLQSGNHQKIKKWKEKYSKNTGDL